MRIVRDRINGSGPNGTDGVARLRPELHDLVLERDVLAMFVAFPDTIMPSEVCTSDFYGSSNGSIFESLIKLYADGELAIGGVEVWQRNLEAVRGHLHDRGVVRSIGEDHVRAILDGIPTRDVDTRRLRRLAARRRIHDAGAAITLHSASGDVGRYAAETAAAYAALEALEGRRSPIEWRETSDLFAPLGDAPWLVPALHIGPGRPALWAGYGSSAKTLAAQALALGVASGTEVFGHFAVPQAAEVRHLDYEQGLRATARRYQRLTLGLGIDPLRLGARLRLAVFPPIFLDSPNAVDVYARACDGAALVIIDALRGATPSSDENDSSIRVCLDNLSRVSEKTGAAFLVLHHAGKPKDGHALDMRTIARGSSAIFDACGAVFVVQQGADADAPRKVTETKPPADAEGRALEPFALVVEDVEIGGDPTGGVRVQWQALEVPSRVEAAADRFAQALDHMAAVVTANPGESGSTLAELAGVGKARALTQLRTLEERGRIAHTVGKGGAFEWRARV